jgi:hypothetical protein
VRSSVLKAPQYPCRRDRRRRAWGCRARRDGRHCLLFGHGNALVGLVFGPGGRGAVRGASGTGAGLRFWSRGCRARAGGRLRAGPAAASPDRGAGRALPARGRVRRLSTRPPPAARSPRPGPRTQSAPAPRPAGGAPRADLAGPEPRPDAPTALDYHHETGVTGLCRGPAGSPARATVDVPHRGLVKLFCPWFQHSVRLGRIPFRNIELAWIGERREARSGGGGPVRSGYSCLSQTTETGTTIAGYRSNVLDDDGLQLVRPATHCGVVG